MIKNYVLLRTGVLVNELPAKVEGYAAKQLDSFEVEFTELVGESDMKNYLIDYMNERYQTTVEITPNKKYDITEYVVCVLYIPECREEDKQVFNEHPINYYWCNLRCGLEVLATSKYKGGIQ